MPVYRGDLVVKSMLKGPSNRIIDGNAGDAKTTSGVHF